tara:strand:+ start:626 stop:1318 length:693 start_codon:yes stop_codon:yes gene_type:complete
MPEDNTPKRRAARPRDAATLVLVRKERKKLCVLMGLRHSRHKFMPDQYVFPGGRVDPSDGYVEAATELRPHVADRLSRSASPHRARALAIAAIRETFEETGLILGEPLKTTPGRIPPAWQDFYAAGYAPALHRLEYIHRAITPPFRPIRFNARFFMANGEDVTGTLEGSGELLNLRWIPVDEALELPTPGIQEVVLRQLASQIDDAAQVVKPARVPVRRMRHGKRVEEFE